MAFSLKFDRASVERLRAKLFNDAKKYRDCPAIFVEYTAPYAIWVHEKTWVQHRIGQAKFLEAAAKRSRERMKNAIAEDLKAGKSFRQANRRAAQILLYDSSRLVPVDTGELRRSGRVRVEEV